MNQRRSWPSGFVEAFASIEGQLEPNPWRGPAGWASPFAEATPTHGGVNFQRAQVGHTAKTEHGNNMQ